MDQKLTRDLKNRGKQAGADIVGIADVDSLRTISPKNDAKQFLEGARAVVIAVVADPPAIQRAADIREYLGMAFPGYQKADGVVTSMRNFLHRKGFRTHFIVREWHKASSKEGKRINTLSLKHAAQAAGLGSIGKHTLLINPKFGPRLRMSGFITDAPLKAGKPFQGQICDGCGACIKACPSDAISEDGKFGFFTCSSYLFAGVDLKGIGSSIKNRNLSVFAENAGRFVQSFSGWIDSLKAGRRLYYTCSRCIRVCNAAARAGKIQS